MLENIRKYRRKVCTTILLLAFGYIFDIIFKCHGILALIVAIPLNILLIIQVSKLSVCKAEYKESKKSGDIAEDCSIIHKDEE